MPMLAVLAPVFNAAGAAGSTFCVTIGSTARAGPNAAARASAIPEILKVPGRFMVRLRCRSTPERPLVGKIGRVVRAVDIGVAVQAAARERVGAGAGARERGDVAAVAGGLVALLAQERLAKLEEVGRGGAVRVMAIGAVFLHRLVGAHERPALLHMAGEAHLGLRQLVVHPVVGGVQLVAGRARDVVSLVRAAGPVHALAALVAALADLVFVMRGHLAEAVRHRAAALQVLARVAVAGGAADDRDWRAAVGLGTVLPSPDERRVGVAVRADLAVLDIVRRLRKSPGRDQEQQCAAEPLASQHGSPSVSPDLESLPFSAAAAILDQGPI